MDAGETGRFDCAECSTEFEVTLEPKSKGEKDHGLPDQPVEYCPFCGVLLQLPDDGDVEDDDDE